MTHAFQVQLPPDFPYNDLTAIAGRLTASKGVHPGFIPPPVGALDLGGLFYAQHQGWSLVVLPDRNLVSRMARVAKDGTVSKRDKPTQVACDLMALAQGMALQLEPSIAYHELAACDGNAAALAELGWFKAADDGAGARDWIDLAMGRIEKVELGQPVGVDPIDLAFPLRRWNRNYIACLKISELALQSGPALGKALELLRWMYEDFQIGGSAAILGLFYLAPSNSHSKLMRRLDARDRRDAIAGVKNAAWDVTHLSDFVKRSIAGEAERRRYFFATTDESLSGVAPALFSTLEPEEGRPLLTDFLAEVWPGKEAQLLVDALGRYIENNDSPHRPKPEFGRTSSSEQ